MTDRSHWGWGAADRFMTPQERRNLGNMVSGVLGIAVADPIEPRPLRSIDLQSARISPPFDFVDGSSEQRIRHTHGRAYVDIVRGFNADFAGAPDAVAKPSSEDEVRQVLDWASDNRIAVVPYGGGTSVVGGVSSQVDGDYLGTISLDLAGLNGVDEIDELSLTARIGAGTRGPAIEDALQAHGLTLRHYPQSFEFSTLGGWIATRAGGHFASNKTHIDDFVQSVRMVAPAGTIQSLDVPASGAGPNPDRLALGSEGTLGVITSARMRVQRRPDHRATASVKFERFDDAVNAVRALAQSGLWPTNCRLLDRHEAQLNQVAFDGSTIVIIGFEAHGISVRERMALALELAEDHGGQCPDGPRFTDPEQVRSADAASTWRNAFFDGPYLQTNLVSLGVMADTFESAVTWSAFESFHRGVKRAVIDALKEVCGGGLVSSRFTHVYPNGVAPYYTFIGAVRRGSEAQQWKEIKQAASEAVVAHGGTITHHHAVGRVHRPWARAQRPTLFTDMMRAAKSVVDPQAILNPGVLW